MSKYVSNIYGAEITPGEAQGPGFVKRQSVYFIPEGTANVPTHSSVREDSKYHGGILTFLQTKSLVQVKLMLMIERQCFSLCFQNGWKFWPPESPWQHDCSQRLIRSFISLFFHLHPPTSEIVCCARREKIKMPESLPQFGTLILMLNYGITESNP